MADSRRIRLIRTAPTIVEPENRRLRLHPEGYQGLRTGASAPWYEGHPPPGVLEMPSDREIGRVADTYYDAGAGGILGTVRLWPTGVSAVADRRRRLIGLGSDRVSVQIVPTSREAESRGADGALDIWSWTIGHLASVGEPADTGAGDELDAAHPYYNLDIVLDWEAVDMADIDLTELATTLPGLISAGIAEGFAQHVEAQRAAEQAAAEALAWEQREQDLARREAELAEREAALHAEPAPAPEPEPAPAPEPEPPPESEQVDEMLRRAAQMDMTYDQQQLAQLAGDRALGRLGDIGVEAMREKLRSVQIQPTRISPPGGGEPAYDIGRALRSVIRGDPAEAPYEVSRSDEIKRASTLGSQRGKLAIPLSALAERAEYLRAQTGAVPPFAISGGHYDLATNTGGSSSSGRAAVDTPHVMTYRSDIPDPLDLRALCSMLPAGPGNPEMIRLTTPDPAHVAEPAERGTNGNPVGDVGYAYTGDITAAMASLSPKLMVCRTAVSRLANLQASDILSIGGMIIMDKHREIESRTILVGSGSNRPTGVYDTTGVASSAELTAGATQSATETAIDHSWRMAGMRRGYVVTMAQAAAMRGWAQPTGVDRYMTPAGNAGSIRDVQVLPTGYWANSGGSGVGEYRGLVGPWSEVYLKEWDGAIYSSMREEDGLEILVTELAWNLWVRFPGEFYRFKDDA